MEKITHKKILETDRVESLADGIFAFSMTLLIVNLAIPEIPKDQAPFLLGSKMFELLPLIADFVLSFVLLAIFWNIHQKQFRGIKNVDESLSWINIFLLLFVVFIPFTTELMARYDNSVTAVSLFNLNLLIIGLLFCWSWQYASSHKLIDTGMTHGQIIYASWKNFVIVPIALPALFLGLFIPNWCTLIYVIVPFVVFFLEKKQLQSK